MKSLFYAFALLLFIFCQNTTVQAAHIVGGYMSYECLGGDDYRFKMVLYRDCFGGGAPFDSAFGSPFPGTVSVYVGNSQFPIDIDGKNHIELPPPAITHLPIDASTGNCTNPPPSLCMEEGVYTFNLTLPVTDQPIHVIYQRCCRSGVITNIENPGDIGMTFIQTITPEARNSCNSSPTFNKKPMICANIDEGLLFHVHRMYDADGDSLAYSFCAPYTGGGPDTNNAESPSGVSPNPDAPPPYIPATFIPPLYSTGQPVPGSPVYQINEESGVIIGQASITGAFVYGLCVEEYRGNVLMGTTRFEATHHVFGTPLSTEEGDYEENLSISPNPAKGYVMLDLPFSTEAYSIKISDLSGKEWEVWKNVGSGHHQMDISDLPKGIYVVSAINGRKKFHYRLVVL